MGGIAMAIYRSQNWFVAKYKVGDKVIVKTDGYIGASANPNLPSIGTIKRVFSMGPIWYYDVFVNNIGRNVGHISERYMGYYSPTTNAEASVSLQKEY
jgi:hypothetical protein